MPTERLHGPTRKSSGVKLGESGVELGDERHQLLPGGIRLVRSHSYRSATTGSTSVARRAGR